MPQCVVWCSYTIHVAHVQCTCWKSLGNKTSKKSTVLHTFCMSTVPLHRAVMELHRIGANRLVSPPVYIHIHCLMYMRMLHIFCSGHYLNADIRFGRFDHQDWCSHKVHVHVHVLVRIHIHVQPRSQAYPHFRLHG